MNMSIFSCDVLNSFEMSTSSKLFNVKYQATAASEASAAANAKTAEKSVKKRKKNCHFRSSKHCISYAACY